MNTNFKSFYSNRIKNINILTLKFNKWGKSVTNKKYIKQFYYNISSLDKKCFRSSYTTRHIYVKSLYKTISYFNKQIDKKNLKLRFPSLLWLWWPKVSEVINWNSHYYSWFTAHYGKSIDLKTRFDPFLFKMIFYNT